MNNHYKGALLVRWVPRGGPSSSTDLKRLLEGGEEVMLVLSHDGSKRKGNESQVEGIT